MPNSPTVALIGSDSLLAREVRDIVATTGVDLALRLVAAVDEESGALTRLGDEPTVVNVLNAESLLDARAVILAGNAESSRQALELLGDPPDAAVIDLTYSAEERPDARLRAPLVESVQEEDPADVAVHVIAHPAAIALALFLRRLHANDPIRSAVIQIFAPASEHGASGVHELQQQTVSLLSFKNLPKDVFDAQLSFNLLARYGEEAPVSLEESELRIERHLASLLALPGDGEGAPMPSLRLIQAPGVSRLQLFGLGGVRGCSRYGGAGKFALHRRPLKSAAAISNRPPTSARPGREASRWAPLHPIAITPRPRGSGSSPITSAWPPRTPSRWRGNWYDAASGNNENDPSTQRRRERRDKRRENSSENVFSALNSAFSASLR